MSGVQKSSQPGVQSAGSPASLPARSSQSGVQSARSPVSQESSQPGARRPASQEVQESSQPGVQPAGASQEPRGAGASQEPPRSFPGASQERSRAPAASQELHASQDPSRASQELPRSLINISSYAEQVATKIGFGHARKTFDKVRVKLPRSSSRQYHGKSQASCDENRIRPC